MRWFARHVSSLRVIACCAGWLLLLPAVGAVAHAQTTGRLSGTVVDGCDRPVEGATVRLSGTDSGRTAAPVRTDGDGRFAFRRLIPGRVSLRIDPPVAGDRAGMVQPVHLDSLVIRMRAETAVKVQLAPPRRRDCRVSSTTDAQPVVAVRSARGLPAVLQAHDRDDAGVIGPSSCAGGATARVVGCATARASRHGSVEGTSRTGALLSHPVIGPGPSTSGRSAVANLASRPPRG